MMNRVEAAKAQISTALLGLLGALLAVMCESSSSLENVLLYVLPFTAGGFLNIALVSLLPELIQEKQASSVCCQLLCVLAGIVAMSLLTIMD